MWKFYKFDIKYVLKHVWDLPFMHLFPLQYEILGLKECHINNVIIAL